MYDRFKQLGVPVVITRDFDEDLSRADRLKRANEAFNGDPNTILISNLSMCFHPFLRRYTVPYAMNKIIKIPITNP